LYLVRSDAIVVTGYLLVLDEKMLVQPPEIPDAMDLVGGRAPARPQAAVRPPREPLLSLRLQRHRRRHRRRRRIRLQGRRGVASLLPEGGKVNLFQIDLMSLVAATCHDVQHTSGQQMRSIQAGRQGAGCRMQQGPNQTMSMVYTEMYRD
jgi:hypothetical protein